MHSSNYPQVIISDMVVHLRTLERASERLQIVVPIALALIFLLIFFALNLLNNP